ncbi:hypothetical protein SDRG_11328 [Saprolegnia diclina VS20]|uniref:Ankyrin repeat protein n=1 Tax=Saprolegnia diclina (strain VS20) TaxID=1156394 RepID=T0Q893_SAPDV|nr:hypothetical protein SDRG_11328 [Saprolegnia diclina VS20]EQC30846.1 hypothetical protein SDRG_11328 [Saprolegnia diclina VS20]|eukprot:XP_008615584.1 hypothetical protein SDRG_11328 [Saprolegnia diclina VS20]
MSADRGWSDGNYLNDSDKSDDSSLTFTLVASPNPTRRDSDDMDDEEASETGNATLSSDSDAATSSAGVGARPGVEDGDADEGGDEEVFDENDTSDLPPPKGQRLLASPRRVSPSSGQIPERLVRADASSEIAIQLCDAAIWLNATLENTTLTLDSFPWGMYPRILDGIERRVSAQLVQTLLERELECSTDAMERRANGHFNVIHFLLKSCRRAAEGCTINALDGATRYGHLDIIRLLIEQGTEGASPNILDRAAADGHLEVVQSTEVIQEIPDLMTRQLGEAN